MAIAGARTARLRCAAVALAVGLAAASPARAQSSVTVRVEVYYYGAVVAGGVGIALFFSGAWESYLGGRAPATALLEIEGGRARAGIPLPVPWAGPEAEPGGPPGGAGIELLRLRF